MTQCIEQTCFSIHNPWLASILPIYGQMDDATSDFFFKELDQRIAKHLPMFQSLLYHHYFAAFSGIGIDSTGQLRTIYGNVSADRETIYIVAIDAIEFPPGV